MLLYLNHINSVYAWWHCSNSTITMIFNRAIDIFCLQSTKLKPQPTGKKTNWCLQSRPGASAAFAGPVCTISVNVFANTKHFLTIVPRSSVFLHGTFAWEGCSCAAVQPAAPASRSLQQLLPDHLLWATLKRISRKALRHVNCVAVGTREPIKHLNVKSSHDCCPPCCCVHQGQPLFSSSWSGWSSQRSMLISWEATASAVLRWSLGMWTTLNNFSPWTMVNGQPSGCTSWDYQRTCDRSTGDCGRRPLPQPARGRYSGNMPSISTHLIAAWSTAECEFRPFEDIRFRTDLFEISYSSEYEEWIILLMWCDNVLKMGGGHYCEKAVFATWHSRAKWRDCKARLTSDR